MSIILSNVDFKVIKQDICQLLLPFNSPSNNCKFPGFNVYSYIIIQ